MVQIRQAVKADVDDLLVLEDACFSVYYYRATRFGAEDFLHYLHAPNAILLVASPNAHAIGYTAAVVRRMRTRRIAHVESIAVLPEHQNQGIGRLLVEALVDEARLRRCQRIVLEVAAANQAGLAFFKRHGFHKIRALPNYYGRNLHGILMAAEI